MKKQLFFLAFVFFYIACTDNRTYETKQASLTSENLHSKMKKEITMAMNQQAAGWNRGNLTAYMNGFWKSDSLLFISGEGLSFGWQQILEGFQRGYPDKNALGRLIYSEQQFTPAGPKSCFVVGKWRIVKKDRTRAGYYSLLWKKINGQWKIIADHTSEDENLGNKPDDML
ncbi:MAG: hypothetical protein MI784_02455 [Cytophagales bacterium]|nr:hypothetical protein [Cytophagales bacterium]